MKVRWRHVASALLVTAGLAFIARQIFRNWQNLEQFHWQVELPGLLLSVLCLVASLGWGAMVWKRVLACFGRTGVPFLRLARLQIFSGLARYIPGSVWQFVAAAHLSSDVGIPAVVLVSSVVVNTGFVLLAAALGVAVLGVGPTLAGNVLGATWLRALAATAAVLLVHPAVINLGLRLVPRALHREVLRWSGGWLDGLIVLALSFVGWMMQGFAFFLFVGSLAPLPWSAAVPLVGVNLLAFLAGYIVLIAPAGLGARELALTFLLSPFLPQAVAGAVSLATRLWTIAAELLAGLLLLPVRPPASGRGGADRFDAPPDVGERLR